MMPAPMPIELCGVRALLRPLTEADIDPLWLAGEYEEIWQFFPTPLRSRDAMSDWVHAALADQEQGRSLPYAIVDRSTGHVVGSTRFADISRPNRSAEIGWTWLTPTLWRTPMNTECKYLLMTHGFETLDLLRIFLKTDARNLRSQRAIERIGAIKEGVHRRDRIIADGFVRDSVYYSVIAKNGLKSSDTKKVCSAPMPNGKVHDRLTVVTAALAVPVWWELSPVKDFAALALALGAYLFSGFWLSDDLDTNSVSYKRWGAFRWLWWPYQKLVPHRSWVSHGVGVGPLVRVLYFVLMLWLVVRGGGWLLGQLGVPIDREALLLTAWHQTWYWTLAHPTWAVWGLIGLVLGGITHSVADAVVSWVKRIW